MTTTTKTVLRVGAASHCGIVRSENQDRISRFRCPLGEVFVVVDGMGGHLDGGRAAELALEVLERSLSGEPGVTDPCQALRRAAEAANLELLRVSAELGEGSGARMGATLVLALVRATRAVIGHAGDSRAYRARAGELALLTRDHTVVQEKVDHKILTPEEARSHPEASMVTRALGQREGLELEVAAPLELAPGDRLLLCSDGLSGYVDDAEIARALTTPGDAQEATRRLLGLALAAGGEDNVSVQVIDVEPAPAKPEPAFTTPAPIKKSPVRNGMWFWVSCGAVLAALVAAGLAGWLG